jgi:hypothetical protein
MSFFVRRDRNGPVLLEKQPRLTEGKDIMVTKRTFVYSFITIITFITIKGVV